MTHRPQTDIRDTRRTARLRVALVAALVVVLTACGGGGGGDDAPAAQARTASSSNSSSGGSGIGVLYCVLGGFLFGLCPDTSGAGGSSSYVGNDDCVDYYCSGTGGVSYPVGYYGGAESTPNSLDVEPNNELATASPAPVGILNAALGLLGFETDGTLEGLIDGTDTYIFAAPRALQIGVQLCEASGPVCDEMTPDASLDVFFAHIAIRDQDGNILATTANDSVNGNLISIAIDGGVPYYVSVVAGYKTFNLLPQSKRYYLRVIGAEPLPEAPPPEPALVQPEAPALTMSASGTMTATLDWIAPVLNTDGTALVDLQGYVLYYGSTEGGPYDFRQPLDLGLSSYTLALPDYGEWFFAVTAVNAHAVESELSNEVALFDPPPALP